MTERQAMRSLFLFIAFIFLFIGIGRADTLQLIDGRTIKGKIVEEGDRIVVQEEGGRMSSFFKDQVVNIIKGDSAPLNIDSKQFPDIESEKVGYIQRLLEANGTKSALERNIHRTIQEAPEERREALTKLFDLNELTATFVPIYDRHFTQDEILALIAFYESPAGAKMLEVAPEIIQEATDASLNYFKEKLTGNK